MALLLGLPVLALSAAQVRAAVTAGADEPSVFVCYSASQPEPEVMRLSEAVALGERPADGAASVAGTPGAYWQPFAVAATAPAASRSTTQLGSFFLTCDPIPFTATGSAVGGSGELYDPSTAAAYRNAGDEALAVYPLAQFTRLAVHQCGGPCFTPIRDPDPGARLSIRTWRARRRGVSVIEAVRLSLCTTRSHGPFSVSIFEAHDRRSLARPSHMLTLQFHLRAKEAATERTLCRNVRYRWPRNTGLGGRGDRQLVVTIAYPIDAPVDLAYGRPFSLKAETTASS